MPTKAKAKATPITPPPDSSFVPPSIDAAKELMNKLIQEELAENWTEDKMRQRIRAALQSDFTHIVKISLGFSKSSWRDEWEVDHCNGRGGNTEVTAQISAIARNELSKVIQEGITQGKFTIGTKEISALQKQFTDYVTGYEARQQIDELAKRRIQRLVDVLEGKLTGADE
jgi:hypothetical protein